MASPTIRAENFKSLRRFEWSPSGVCALVGPNGSGKSTALRLLPFLGNAVREGYGDALRLFGSGPLRSFESEAAPKLELSLDGLTWSLVVERTTEPEEHATRGTATVISRSRSPEGSWISVRGDIKKSVPNRAYELVMSHVDEGADADLIGLRRLIEGSRYYSQPDLSHLREVGSIVSNDVVLDTRSRNLFAVLRNWRDQSAHEERWEFVTQGLKECQRDFRRFNFSTLAQRVAADLPAPNGEQLPASDWSDGFMTVLCHLVAVASVDVGVVAIDELENSLHPELIVRTMEFLREWSRRRRVTVLLATHSPVVLDQFRAEPERVFVMQPNHPTTPVPLDQLKKRDWLEHFSIGDLYSHSEVGAPH